MKRLISLFLCLNLFVLVVAQDIISDTTLAGLSYRRAKYMLDNRMLDKLDSILILSQQSEDLYSKHKDSIGLLRSLSNQIHVYALKRNETQTMVLFERIINESRKDIGENNLYIASAYHYLGLYYNIVSKPDQALEYYNKSLEIRLNILGEKNLEVAISYNNIGNCYSLKGNYDKALEFSLKSLTIRKGIKETKPVDLVSSYQNIGLIYWYLKEFDNALKYDSLAVQLLKDKFGEDNLSIASTFFNIAIVYHAIKEDEKALEYNFKVLQIREKILGNKHQDLVKCFDNIGHVYNAMKQYDKSLEYYKQALEIRKETVGVKSREAASVYSNMGAIYNIKNEYDKAIENYSEALEIRKDILGENNALVADSYDRLAYVYYAMFKNIFNDAIFNTLTSRDNEYFRAFSKGLEFKLKSLEIRENLADYNKLDIAKEYYELGRSLIFMPSDLEKSIFCSQKALKIYKEELGETHVEVANVYGILGCAYEQKLEFDLSLENLLKEFEFYKKLLSDNDTALYQKCIGLGNVYYAKSEYNKALEFYLNALKIKTITRRWTSVMNVWTCQLIGNTYLAKAEYDKALEYQLKALDYCAEIGDVGEPQFKEYIIASCNKEIGNTYISTSEYDLAIVYLLKSMKGMPFSGKLELAGVYTNLGNVYSIKDEYDKALLCYEKSLTLNQPDSITQQSSSLTELHNYMNIGDVWSRKKDYYKALEYYNKSLTLNKDIFKKKHSELAKNYNLIGNAYSNLNDNNLALNFYQKALCANLRNYNDTLAFTLNPKINDYLDFKELIKSLQGKAKVLKALADNENKNKASINILNLSIVELRNLALQNYILCDTVITQVRKSISKTSDKLAIGTLASQVYDDAINICINLAITNDYLKVNTYNELAFYFAEQNKSIVLLEAISGKEGLKFVGIPDSLVQKEHNLMIDIAFYEKKLAEVKDSADKVILRSRLFTFNRQYEELIKTIESNYPEYSKLKYNTQTPTIKELQNFLDEKTAIRTYFSGNNELHIFTLTKEKLDINQIPYSGNLTDSIKLFRYGLINLSPRMQENYRRLGFYLYQMLFPDINSIDSKIENIIIIPDGGLATIPFESLLTESYEGNINEYKEYPYLLKKLNISYSYSANLYYQTFYTNKSSTTEITNLNDWIGLAPVFNNPTKQNITRSTTELKRSLNWLKTDSLMVSRPMFDLNYITPLPATETETEAIFKLYEDKKLKAKILLHDDANEQLIKAGELEKFKILHFATHGFVNSMRPELSGLLLAQDTTGGEDGVLYSGEIYNLKLNADLVVLSACETGLGKIQKGEGIIGLTRALLYAGAKNIVVSLWKVADESTSDLMVDFYKGSLTSKGKLSYSEALRSAKLKMISEGKYAHPLYWSPFILIGK